MSRKATPVILDMPTRLTLNNIANDPSTTDTWKTRRAMVVLQLANGTEVEEMA